MQCSSWYFYYQSEEACHSQPSAWVNAQLQWPWLREGTLKSQPRLMEESQSREPTVPCKWHPSVSWRTQSYPTSGKLSYTLGFLKRTSGCDIRWKLLYLFSWKCSIFQSGLCSPIKITDPPPSTAQPVPLLFHILVQASERTKCEWASMGFFSSQRNPDLTSKKSSYFFLLFFSFNQCIKSFHANRKFSESEIIVWLRS